MGRTVLHDAAGDYQSTMQLILNGANVNILDKDNVSPLLLNAKLDSLQCIQILLENGKKKNILNLRKKNEEKFLYTWGVKFFSLSQKHFL